MASFRFDLQTLFIWTAYLAVASAVARLDYIAAVVTAVGLTMALVRANFEINLQKSSGQRQPLSNIIFCHSVAILAVVVAACVGAVLGMACVPFSFIAAMIVWAIWDFYPLILGVMLAPLILVGAICTWKVFRASWPQFGPDGRLLTIYDSVVAHNTREGNRGKVGSADDQTQI